MDPLEIRINSVANLSGAQAQTKSITELRGELALARKAFEDAKPNTPEQAAAIAKVLELGKAIDAQNAVLATAAKALDDKAAAEKKAAEETAKAAAAELKSVEATKARIEAMFKAREAAKETAKVQAMGNPWATSGKAEMDRQREAARAAANVQAMGNPWTTASRGMQQVKADAEAVEKAVEKGGAAVRNMGKAAEAAAGKGGQGGQGMLLLGQAVEDMQYGLRGVMNNIPGLVMSFGLGAGAAGVLQVGLVAVSQILDVIKAQSAAMPDDKPLLTALSFDAEQENQARKFIEGLNQATEAIKRRNDELVRGAEALAKSVEHERELNAIYDARADKDFVSTGDPVQDAFERERITKDRIERDANLRRQERGAKAATADSQVQNATGDLARADSQYQEQKDLVDGVKQRDIRERRLRDLNKSIADDSRRLSGTFADPIADPKGFGRDIMNRISGGGDDAALAKSLAARMDEAAKLQSELKPGKLPALPGFTPSGDAAKDQETRAGLLAKEEERLRDLETRRKDALAEVESAKAKAEAEKTALGRDQQLDDERTTDAFKGAESTRETAVANAVTAEAQPPAPDPQAQAQGDAAVTAGVGQIDALIAGSQNGAFNAKMQELRATLTDRDGATAQDVQAIKSYLETVKTSSAEGNKMISGLLSSMAQAQIAFNADLQSLRATVDGIKSQQRAF